MFLTLIFWLSMLLPGYVGVRLAAKEDLETGLFGTIGLAYLAAFAILSPFSILCYIAKLPVAVMATIYVLVLVVSAVLVTHRRWWGDVGRLFATGIGLEALILIGDMILSYRSGGYLMGDAEVHVARIRSLLESNFNNFDPFVGAEYFYPQYHTNILYALCATCAKLTQTTSFEVWFTMFVWVKLVVFSSFFYLGHVLFNSRWVAGLIALFVLAQVAPANFYMYPNRISPFWLLPLMSAFVVQTIQPNCSYRIPLKIAVGSFVLAQVHALYAVFAGIAFAPFLLGLLLVRVARRRPCRLPVIACVLALGVGAPFVLIGKAHFDAEAVEDNNRSLEKKNKTRFDELDNGWIVKKPPSRGTIALFLLGAVPALAGRRRKEALVPISYWATTAIIFFVPPVCTAVVEIFGQPNTVNRLNCLLHLAYLSLVPGALGLLVEDNFKKNRWLHSCAYILVFLLGTLKGPTKEDRTWPYYLKAAWSSPDNAWYRQLDSCMDNRSFYEKNIPTGATLLTDGKTALKLVMLHNCHVVLPSRTSLGVDGYMERKRDLQRMLFAKLPWKDRQKLLEKYGISMALFRKKVPPWANGRALEILQNGKYYLVKLRLDDAN